MAEWLLLFTPQNRPWGLINRDGKGLTPAEVPSDLREHVERQHGPFDATSKWQFQGVRGEYLDWPLPVPGAKRAITL